MTTKSQYRAGTIVFYEDKNFESTVMGAPLTFGDDFVGAGHTAIPAAGTHTAGYPWVKRIVGAGPPTVAPVTNAIGGQFSLALAAASEKEDAVLNFDDSLCLDATKNSTIEFRAALAVAPSAAAVQAVWGLAAAWIDGPDNNSFYMQFGATANANLLVRSKDGVSSPFSLAAATIGDGAITLDTNFHTFRIEMAVLTDIAFFFDGNRVNAMNSVSFAATGANAVLQPYMAVYKPSGTGVATLLVDKVDFWGNRQ